MNTSSFRDKEAGRKGQQPHFTLKDSQLLLLSVVIFVDTFLVHSCLTFHVLDVLKVHFSMHMFISTMLRMLCICVRIYIYISSTPQHSNKTLRLALQIVEMKRLTWVYVVTLGQNLKLDLPT